MTENLNLDTRHSPNFLPFSIFFFMNAPKAWCTNSYYADYTNNPTIYETAFLRKLLSATNTVHEDHLRKFESSLIELWRPKRYGVGWVNGLFTHDRLDRTMTLP
jgi:hypothetical protein